MKRKYIFVFTSLRIFHQAEGGVIRFLKKSLTFQEDKQRKEQEPKFLEELKNLKNEHKSEITKILEEHEENKRELVEKIETEVCLFSFC